MPYNESKAYYYGLQLGNYVWDATNVEYVPGGALGHIINSCHPELPHPYNKSNVLYIAGTVGLWEGDKKSINIYRGGVFALETICEDTELLTDYHWLLEGVQFNHNCDKCDEMRAGGTTCIMELSRQ